MQLNKSDIEQLDRVKRLNIINGLTGIKPANLVGTVDENGKENLAIISSVVHLGSNPALLGFVMRPVKDVPRNTFTNIEKIQQYTINAVESDKIHQAHYTSAKFDAGINEFEQCHFQSEYIPNFKAPFVATSPIKIGLSLAEIIPIQINNTLMVVGSIEHIILTPQIVNEKGYIDLDQAQIAGVGGLNTYYDLSQIGQFPYARVHELPKFES